MCMNHNCPSKNICYRYYAYPCFYQSYSDFVFDKDTGKCEYIIERKENNDYIK